MKWIRLTQGAKVSSHWFQLNHLTFLWDCTFSASVRDSDMVVTFRFCLLGELPRTGDQFIPIALPKETTEVICRIHLRWPESWLVEPPPFVPPIPYGTQHRWIISQSCTSSNSPTSRSAFCKLLLGMQNAKTFFLNLNYTSHFLLIFSELA